jgi:hypothetical protein
MADFPCRCGAMIKTTGALYPVELLMIVDHEVSERDTWESIGERMTHVFRCFECHRLWVFRDGLNVEPASYALEDLDAA